MKQFTLLLLFIVATFTVNAQISEGFEGSFPPEGWAAFPGTSGSSAAEWAQQDDFETAYGSFGWAHTGDYAVISSFDWEGPTEGWLVTPQFTPTAANHILYFHQRQAYEDEYFSELTIRVSTASQTTHADFTIVDTQTEADISFRAYEPHTVDLSAYIDTPIYVAFVHAQDDDDELYIDSVLTAPMEVPGPSTNPSPADGETGVAITNTQTSHIAFSWEAPTTGGIVEQYNFSIGDDPTHLRLLGHPTDFSANPSIFHFNTTYYWQGAALNMGGNDAATWSFTTAIQPTVDPPYTIDFENDGFVPDGCDQLVTNQKWWKYTNTVSGHIGNVGTTEGTTTNSGGYFAYIDDSTSPDALGTTFATPFVNVSILEQPAFSFYMISNDEADGNVDFSVQAGNEEIGYSVVFTSNTNTAGWEKKVVNLGSIDCSEPIQLRFIVDENTHTTKDDFAIDDIYFDEYSVITLGTTQETITGLACYPNPATDTFTVTAQENIDAIEITNLLGQTVLKLTPSAITTAIDISNLAKGSYMVKIAANDKFTTVKMIKE